MIDLKLADQLVAQIRVTKDGVFEVFDGKEVRVDLGDLLDLLVCESELSGKPSQLFVCERAHRTIPFVWAREKLPQIQKCLEILTRLY